MASEAVRGSRRAERSGHGLAAGFLACCNGRERQTRADGSEAFLFALSLSLSLFTCVGVRSASQAWWLSLGW
jgi:hypothetical protein